MEGGDKSSSPPSIGEGGLSLMEGGEGEPAEVA